MTQRNLELFNVIHSLEYRLRTKVLQNAQLWHLPFCQELVNINTKATTGDKETGKKEGDTLIATAIASHRTPPKNQYRGLQMEEDETSAEEEELEDNKVKTLVQCCGIQQPV